MEDFLFNISLNEQTLYLAVILLVLGEGLKGLSFVKKQYVIWILLAISIIINFIFHGVTFYTLFESVIATSLSVFAYDLIKESMKFKIDKKVE